jgi:hypothetical protein
MLDIESDPYSMFIFAMNAPQTREKYVTRLKRFFRSWLSLHNRLKYPTKGLIYEFFAAALQYQIK